MRACALYLEISNGPLWIDCGEAVAGKWKAIGISDYGVLRKVACTFAVSRCSCDSAAGDLPTLELASVRLGWMLEKCGHGTLRSVRTY